MSSDELDSGEGTALCEAASDGLGGVPPQQPTYSPQELAHFMFLQQQLAQHLLAGVGSQQQTGSTVTFGVDCSGGAGGCGFGDGGGCFGGCGGGFGGCFGVGSPPHPPPPGSRANQRPVV